MDERHKFSKVAVGRRTWRACVRALFPCGACCRFSRISSIQLLHVLPLLPHTVKVSCEDLEGYRYMSADADSSICFWIVCLGLWTFSVCCVTTLASLGPAESLPYTVLLVARCLSVVQLLQWFELWRPLFFFSVCASVVIIRPSFHWFQPFHRKMRHLMRPRIQLENLKFCSCQTRFAASSHAEQFSGFFILLVGPSAFQVMYHAYVTVTESPRSALVNVRWSPR